MNKYKGEIDKRNIFSLKSICLLYAVLSLAIIPFVWITERFGTKVVLCLAAFALSAVITFYADGVIKGKFKPDHRKIYILIRVMIICALGLVIYIGTYGSEGDLAVYAIWAFSFLQVLFVIVPVENLTTMIVGFIVFSACSYFNKSYRLFSYDMMHAFVSVTVGFFLAFASGKHSIVNLINSSKLTEVNSSLYLASTTDSLTGLYNRKRTFELMDKVVKESVEKNLHVQCLVFDIDDFKQFNDSYGHPEGDELLKAMGESLNKYSQNSGVIIGRIGGEEFMACSLGGVAAASNIAISIREKISQIPLKVVCENKITVSIGLVNDDLASFGKADNVYRYADKALYVAKANGKNCVYKYHVDTKQYTRLIG